MYPQALELCESNTYIFCGACLQATPTNNHMTHPGPWLNTTDEPQRAGTQPILDLTVTENRPWPLQSLGADYDKDFAPFVWILAVPAEAQSAHEGVIQHFWDHSLSRWRRLPLSHINTKGSITNYDIDEFQKLTGKIWKLKGQRALKTLNFISRHATASFFHLAEEQRQQILTTFINWETHRIQAGLTGLRSNLHEFFQSDRNDIFLKQFWTIVLPSLHHHFLCCNPACKKVVMSHHWVTTLSPNARRQGRYLCPCHA